MTETISRNAPCTCGSGKRFKNCCGQLGDGIWLEEAAGRIDLADPRYAALIANEPRCNFADDLPPGLFVTIMSGLEDLQQLAAKIAAQPLMRHAEVSYHGKDVRDGQRVTELVELGPFQEPVNALVHYAFTAAAGFYGTSMATMETPQVLRYRAGGFYRPHVDNAAWKKDQLRWERELNRDLSLLIYLDDDYTGGELSFPNFGYRLRPRSGMVAAFPSDYRYLHGAMPVLSGVRHAIVSWGTTQQPIGDPAAQTAAQIQSATHTKT